jgi:hypothetical protein
MSLLWSMPRLRRSAASLVAVAALFAVSAASTPAEARVWVGLNFGVPWGYAPGYYPPPPYPYPAYYGYPAYGYPGWRHRRWCWHHPYRCRW